MENYLSVKHSFNSGDLIVLLSGLKQLHQNTGKKILLYQYLNLPAFYYQGAEHPVRDADNNMVCMNEAMWAKIKPLLDNQSYIYHSEVWQGQKVDYDIDLTRDSKSIPMPAGLLHYYASAIFPEMNGPLTGRWIEAYPISHVNTTMGATALSDKIIINRTERYQNPYITYFFLKKYENKIVFSGLPDEHQSFCKTWKLDLPLLLVNNFYELASAISSSAGFLGNQSFCWHLADAQKVPRILELCTVFPNTFPTGDGGAAFYKQKSLEYHFEKLINI